MYCNKRTVPDIKFLKDQSITHDYQSIKQRMNERIIERTFKGEGGAYFKVLKFQILSISKPKQQFHKVLNICQNRCSPRLLHRLSFPQNFNTFLEELKKRQLA